jgi:hypothetical protein
VCKSGGISPPTKEVSCYHRLSINRPTQRGKEKSPNGHCQWEKEMDDDGVSTNS